MSAIKKQENLVMQTKSIWAMRSSLHDEIDLGAKSQLTSFNMTDWDFWSTIPKILTAWDS